MSKWRFVCQACAGCDYIAKSRDLETARKEAEAINKWRRQYYGDEHLIVDLTGIDMEAEAEQERIRRKEAKKVWDEIMEMCEE